MRCIVSLFIVLLAMVITCGSLHAQNVPVLGTGGIVDPTTNRTSLVAGSVATAYGLNLGSIEAATISPLPTRLGSTQLLFGGSRAAPLFYVSPGQINFQVPWELAGTASASVTASVGGVTSQPQNVTVTSAAPGIFTVGGTQGAILDASTGILAAPAGTVPGRTTAPATIRGYIAIFCNGLGAVSNQPATGAPGPSDPLAQVLAPVIVSIGGIAVNAQFAGLAPGLVGVYQVNAQIPFNVPIGNSVPITIQAGSAVSNTATIAIASVDSVTGLPSDVTPLLSVAGTWQAVADKYIDPKSPPPPAPPAGGIADSFAGNIRLPNGREGLVVTGWAYSGFSNAATSVTPVNIAILEQQADGTLQVATSKYVSDAQTNGGSNVLVADFNKDGIPDFFLPAHNESPALPASSTAYLSNGTGAYSKIVVGDQVEAHGATVVPINGTPTVFTASYYVAGPPPKNADTVEYFNGKDGFTIIPDVGVGGNSSIAVGDFYGDGSYSAVYGDFLYGPGYSFDPAPHIYLYHLSNLLPVGSGLNVGRPYFDGKPQFAQYPSFKDPYGKSHNYRAWLDDFNHDGKLDIVVGEMIWTASGGETKNVLQMFQNNGNYQFNDVTDFLNPAYDQNCVQLEYVPQVRDIDGSSINSYLLASTSLDSSRPQGNYVIVNDGTGMLYVALHDTLNAYSRQIGKWLAGNSTLLGAGFYFGDGTNVLPAIRAYQTADGLLNFVALVATSQRKNGSPFWVSERVFVNLPLQFDVRKQFTQPITVANRRGSHLIRTFAGDDTIYSGNDGGYAKIDGGLGTNTVVYAGPSRNYSITKNGDGSWTVKDNVGTDGIDTLIRIQRLQFTDTVVTLN